MCESMCLRSQLCQVIYYTPSMTESEPWTFVLRARLKYVWPEEFGVIIMSVGWRTVIGKTTVFNVQLNKYLLKTNNYFQPNPSFHSSNPKQHTSLFSFSLVILLHGSMLCFIPHAFIVPCKSFHPLAFSISCSLTAWNLNRF